MPTGVVGTPHVRPLQLQCHPRLRPRLQQDHGRVSLQGGTCQPFSLPLPTPAILLSLLYCPLPPHCHPVTSLSPPIMPLDNPPVTSLSPRACCHPVSSQDNHYRLPGGDTCHPCECYPTGSLSRRCDPNTGQCPCKAGVIGRHCDRCDNPFAEVTASGCEGGGLSTCVTLCHPAPPCVPHFDALLCPAVNYDSCPRAIEAGIWWPRTRFGLPAAAPCPKGSVGTWGHGWEMSLGTLSEWGWG